MGRMSASRVEYEADSSPARLTGARRAAYYERDSEAPNEIRSSAVRDVDLLPTQRGDARPSVHSGRGARSPSRGGLDQRIESGAPFRHGREQDAGGLGPGGHPRGEGA